MKSQDMTMIYEIHIQGYLGKNAVVWFGGFELEHTANGTTILRGPIIDQADLHGVLNRIRDLGLPLILVQKIEKDL